MICRSFRYRLYPSPETTLLLEQTANARRYVYNLALEQRRDFWRQARAAGVRFDFVTQGREVTQLRKELPWLAAIHTTPLTMALRDLDRAFSEFYARRSKYPAFQSRDRHKSFAHKGTALRFVELVRKWCLIRVPGIGMVKMRVTRPWEGRIVRATFSRDALGWHVSLVCEIAHEQPEPLGLSVGIDRGVANTLALSTGEFLSTPDVTTLERRKRAAQRVLARRKRGSRRYQDQRRRLTSIAATIARVRHNWQHEVTTSIAGRFGAVALENLNTAAMTKAGVGKSGLNRSIRAQGWGDFEAKLIYKIKERGGTLIKINPAFTSQQCSACGVIDKRSRESQARFACRHCDYTGHADTNAAINILRRCSAGVEEAGCRSVEAQTAGAVGICGSGLTPLPNIREHLCAVSGAGSPASRPRP